MVFMVLSPQGWRRMSCSIHPLYWPRTVWRPRAFRALIRLPSPLEARKASVRTEGRAWSVALLAHHRGDVVDEVDLRDHRGDGSVLLDEGHFPLGEDGGQAADGKIGRDEDVILVHQVGHGAVDAVGVFQQRVQQIHLRDDSHQPGPVHDGKLRNAVLLHEADDVGDAVARLGGDHRVALALDQIFQAAVRVFVVQERVLAQPVVVVHLAQVARSRVGQEDDDRLALGIVLRELDRPADGAAAGAAREQPLLARQLARRQEAFLVGDLIALVDVGEVEGGRQEILAEPFHLVRLEAAGDRLRLEVVVQDRADGIDQHEFHRRLALLDVPPDAAERAPGPRRDDDRVDLALRLHPDLRPGRAVVRLGIALVVILIGEKGIRRLRGDALRHGIVRAGILRRHGGRCRDHLRPEGAQGLDLLVADLVRHDEHHAIAAGGADHRQPHSGVAAGALDDRPAGLERSAALGVIDHLNGDAILHRVAGIRILELGIERGAGFPADAIETYQRRAADSLADVFENFGHGRILLRVEGAMMNGRSIGSGLCLLWLIGSWAVAGMEPAAAGARGADENAIRRVLDQQTEAWNRGDLEGYMQGYWQSPDLTFYSGGTITGGWDSTLARYRKRYQSEGRQMGRLDFSGETIELLGPDAALARGRWRLVFPDGKQASGLYTVILKRLPVGWRIVHDHSSADER